MKGKYFTERERYIMETLLQEGYKPREIALRLGKCVATIYNEIKRGKTEQLDGQTYLIKTVYFADVAQNRYLNVRKNKGINLKVGNDYDFVRYVEHEIAVNKRSPKALIGYMRSHSMPFKTQVCYKTLYNYIESGLFLNISNKDLPVKRNKQHRKYHKVKVSLNHKTVRLIDDRPESILSRTDFGHWEMDTVVSGTNTGKSCLLVMSERASRLELIYKMPSKHASNTVAILDKIQKKIGLKRFRQIFKTITVDNGTEFADTKGIEKHKRTTLYYCHPYSSWERGTNENINKMIRRFIPKGTNIDHCTEDKIKWVADWINNYPREIHGFYSANEVAQKFNN